MSSVDFASGKISQLDKQRHSGRWLEESLPFNLDGNEKEITAVLLEIPSVSIQSAFVKFACKNLQESFPEIVYLFACLGENIEVF